MHHQYLYVAAVLLEYSVSLLSHRGLSVCVPAVLASCAHANSDWTGKMVLMLLAGHTHRETHTHTHSPLVTVGHQGMLVL